MGRLFDSNNAFFTFMGKVADLIILNIVFLVTCIPIVTIGASLTALYYVSLKMVRNEESYIIQSFFKSFRQNFRQATVIHLIMLFFGIMLFLDIRISRVMEGTNGKVLTIAVFAIGLLYAFVLLYVYPVLSKFYNSIRNTFKNALLMSIRHLPFTVAMLIISVLPAGLFLIPNFRVQSMAVLFILMLGFAAVAYCNSCFLVRIFDNYIPKEEETPEALPDSGAAPQ